MRRFRDGELDVLVATTVIEVGIDVPNATMMLVEHPERFGLSQLHQLRGRMGRGAEESFCILHVRRGRGRAAPGVRGHAGRVPDRRAGSRGARDGRPDRRAPERRVRGASRAAARRHRSPDAERGSLPSTSSAPIRRSSARRTSGSASGRWPGIHGRWSCSGWDEGDRGCRRAARTLSHPHPRRLAQAPHLGLERNVVRLRGVPGELPDEHGRGAQQCGLAAEQPASRVPVVAERLLIDIARCRRPCSRPGVSTSHSAWSSKQRDSSALNRSSARSWARAAR